MHFRFHNAVIVTLLASLAWSAHAAPIHFSQRPNVNTWHEPAPNIIISVDDSASMANDIQGCPTKIDHIDTLPLQYYPHGNPTCNYHNAVLNPNPSRMAILRHSLLHAFGDARANPPSTGLIPDDSIRLAWQAMHDNGHATSGRGARALSPGKRNTMRSFSGAHRRNFHDFVTGLKSGNDTPSHAMMHNAYTYMRSKTGLHSPWADEPGIRSHPYLGCRRSYHIFLTDGIWTTNNRVSLRDMPTGGDSTTLQLPDQQHTYDTRSSESAVYRDNYHHTLSDYAFLSWATDLQDGQEGRAAMENNVRPLIRRAQPETFYTPHCSTTNSCTTLTAFWNPRNDPATWQHLTLYTIGFGKEATHWRSVHHVPPEWDHASDNTYGGDLALLANEESTWADVLSRPLIRSSELWHMALNGRGKYFPAHSAETLTSAFREIFDSIQVDSNAPITTTATNTSFLRLGQQMFQAHYDSESHSGSLIARPLDPHTGAVQADVAWDAAALLNAMRPADRFLLSSENHVGVSWSNYAQLPAVQQKALGTSPNGQPDALSEARWRYLRGDRSQEAASGGPFRDRKSRMGDMVHSTIWYLAKPGSGHRDQAYANFRSSNTGGKGNRTPMVYVGANDGMLHGFAATTGQELLAYIPVGIAAGPLRHLTDPDYTHQYHVDGSVFTGDFWQEDAKAWNTALVGTLGAGGKGYFVLDVTDPARFKDAEAHHLVLRDTTDQHQDRDLGHMFTPPVVDDAAANTSRQIVKMNTGRWAVLLGNGYNSRNEAPVLLIQYLDGDRARIQLSPCTQPIAPNACTFKNNNGLSPPQAIDLNNNGTIDVVYAGDLLGHLWKFDVSSKDAREWHVAFDGAPFFAAPRKNHTAQAITTAPLWRPHPLGGIQLAFGTGRELSPHDASSTATNTLYALRDDSKISVTADGVVTMSDGSPINAPGNTALPATLVRQNTQTAPVIDGDIHYYASSTLHVDYAGNPTSNPPVAAHRGWYMHLPFDGQRVLDNPRAFAGDKVMFLSTVPPTGSGNGTSRCKPPQYTPRRHFISILNLFTGKPAQTQAFHSDVLTLAPHTSMRESPGGTPAMVRTESQVKLLPVNCPRGQICSATNLRSGHYQGARGGWHQIR